MAGDLALVSDAEGFIVYISPAVAHLSSYETDEIVGSNGWDFVHPDDVQAAMASYAEAVEGGGSRTFVVRLRLLDGTWRWVQETVTNQMHTGLGGMVCNLRDVTTEVEVLEALRVSEARHRAIADTAEEGIWAISPSGDTLYANARLAAILGVPLEVVCAGNAVDLLDPTRSSDLDERLEQRAVRGPERYEIGYLHPDGVERRLVVSATPLRAPGGVVEGALGMVSDVTQARIAERDLRRAALHDSLTGLPNRTLLLDRLQHALERETTTTGVLFIDLDQFKLVNDSRGHAVGDDLLVAVGQRLRNAARAHDTVARFGGDEFVVVCEDTDAAQAKALAQQLLAALAEPLEVRGALMNIGASIGVAVSPPSHADDLLRFADTAMYAAKGSGPGQVRLFEPALGDEAEQRWALSTDLRTALTADELRLHYQPVVDLSTGEVVGMEALARWSHPVHGTVSPEVFVHVGELTGLAPELDGWALRTALRDAGQAREAGRLPARAFVSVNVTARTLADPELEALVVAWTKDAGLHPADVVLEITEGSLVQESSSAGPLLRRLRARGFGVLVDDFGTGFSSLSYLRELPITGLKIDRSFVADITDDRDALAIVASIVDLTRAVGLIAVAEGVESAQQASLLRGLGCTQAQGWLWSPAVPVEEVGQSADWLRGFAVPPLEETRSAPPARRRAPAVEEPAGPEHGRSQLLEMHAQGASLATIAAALNSEGFRTPSGLRWHRTSVARVVAERAYPALVDSDATGRADSPA